MPDALLDTTVFFDDYARDSRVSRPVRDVRHGRLRAYYSPITVFEIWLKPMTREEEAHHLALLSVCIEAPFSSQAARFMAGWLAGRARAGRKALFGDVILAATAASLGATIYTRNPRDFLRFYPDVLAY